MNSLRSIYALILLILLVVLTYYVLTLDVKKDFTEFHQARTVDETLSPQEQFSELNKKWDKISKKDKRRIISNIKQNLDRESRVKIQRRYLYELSQDEKNQAYNYYYNLLDDCFHGRKNPDFTPEIDPKIENPCAEGADCWYAWKLEQQCGEILDLYFPHCFFNVNYDSKVSCLSSKKKVYRDVERWDPNLKSRYKSYVLME